MSKTNNKRSRNEGDLDKNEPKQILEAENGG